MKRVKFFLSASVPWRSELEFEPTSRYLAPLAVRNNPCGTHLEPLDLDTNSTAPYLIAFVLDSGGQP